MKFCYFLITLSLFCRCIPAYDPPQEGIEIFNNTDSVYYVAYSFSDTLKEYYPFVLFEEINIGTLDKVSAHNYRKQKQSPCYRLNAYSYGCIGIPGRETLLQRCDNNILRLFFIPDSTMREKSFTEICKYRLYEKKLTLTEEELKNNNWIVVYE